MHGRGGATAASLSYRHKVVIVEEPKGVLLTDTEKSSHGCYGTSSALRGGCNPPFLLSPSVTAFEQAQPYLEAIQITV
jgi:hypothetical protein